MSGVSVCARQMGTILLHMTDITSQTQVPTVCYSPLECFPHRDEVLLRSARTFKVFSLLGGCGRIGVL